MKWLYDKLRAKAREKNPQDKLSWNEALEVTSEHNLNLMANSPVPGESPNVFWFIVRTTRGGKYIQF